MYIDTNTRTPFIQHDALSEFLGLLSFRIKSVGLWHSDFDARANYTADDIELVYYLCGGSTSTVNGRTYTCTTGDLMILPPASLTTSINEGYKEYEYFYIHFNVSPLYLEERFVHSILEKGNVLRIEPESPMARLLSAMITESKSEQDGYRSMLCGMLQNLSVYILRETGITPKERIETNEETALLSRIIKDICTHLDQPISIKQLAKRHNISESTLHKCFKKNLNLSPLQYIQKKKYEFALRALLSNDYTVSEVAEMIGYKSISSFTHFFQSQSGKTPSEFKKAQSQ